MVPDKLGRNASKGGNRVERFLIVGGDRDGAALLRALDQMDRVKVVGVVASDPQAPAFVEAQSRGIPVGTDPEPFFNPLPDVIIQLSEQPDLSDRLPQRDGKKPLLISGAVSRVLVQLIEDKEKWFEAWRRRQGELHTIIDSTHDGMIAVNHKGEITLFNRSAERLMGLKAEDVIGKPVAQAVPGTGLDRVLKTGRAELNRQQELPNGIKIVTNRVPVKDRTGRVIGVVAVFRDITEVLALTKQVTDLESMKSLLQAIIDSSDEAISVVDSKGIGILINPAYTRLTGLPPEEVIGKPADADISEGESMHMKVLKTRKPVRGVPLKVGPNRKDVVVNVAPIIVDGELKGSVGIIHDMSEIKRLNRELERARQIIRTLEAKYTFDDIIGESEGMRMAIDQARQAARTRATVLLRGESGTGKELFAHAIHNDSDRRFHQFVRVNCAAISESLLESELFGYEEGAFTGARPGGKKGLFEEASGGTIFLDEIGELAPNIQAKLLRVLQEKEVIRVGGTRPISVDVRVIAATNLHLEKAIQEKRFREDLYYRLNVLPISIPPLRFRKEDLPLLARHLIKKFNQEYGRNVEEIDEDAIRVLMDYDWPGNVRELENVLGRAMINMNFSERRMKREHLPPLFGLAAISGKRSPAVCEKSGDEMESLQEVLARTEREYIEKVYRASRGNKTETARRLGISVRNLYYKLERYGIE